jgi:hypothetical protein
MEVAIMKQQAASKLELADENKRIAELALTQEKLEREYKLAKADKLMTKKELAALKKQVEAGKLNLAELEAEEKRIEQQQKDDIVRISSNHKAALAAEEQIDEALAELKKHQAADIGNLKSLDKEMSIVEKNDRTFKKDNDKLVDQLQKELAETASHSKAIRALQREYWQELSDYQEVLKEELEQLQDNEEHVDKMDENYNDYRHSNNKHKQFKDIQIAQSDVSALLESHEEAQGKIFLMKRQLAAYIEKEHSDFAASL